MAMAMAIRGGHRSALNGYDHVRSEGKAFGATAPIPYQVLRAVELHGWGDQKLLYQVVWRVQLSMR